MRTKTRCNWLAPHEVPLTDARPQAAAALACIQGNALD